MIDRKTFFNGVKAKSFLGPLNQGQVDGMNAILDEYERRGMNNFGALAYILATPCHETGRTMQPVIETRSRRETENPSVDEAIRRLDAAWKAGRLKWVKKPYWRKDPDGFSWLGRGFVQLTHKGNYINAEQKLGLPFTIKPEIALELGPATQVLFQGMTEGWFRPPHNLDRYFGHGKKDFYNAREIINAGHESADTVRDLALKFDDVLTAAVS